MKPSGTIGKAVQLLEVLRDAGQAQGLAELAERAAMPKPTVHRLLVSLSANNLVEPDGRGRYRLGSGLLRLALGVLNEEPIVRAARPHLEHGAARLGETFFVVVARAGRLRVLDKVEGSGILRAAPEVGSEVPVETTASGRLYLAHAPELLDARVSTKTVTDAALRRAVSRARNNGYDINRSEWIDGLGVVAAPVLADGRLYGCIACAMPSAALDETMTKRVVRATTVAAKRASAALGGAS